MKFDGISQKFSNGLYNEIPVKYVRIITKIELPG